MSHEWGNTPLKVIVFIIGVALLITGIFLGLKTCGQSDVTEPKSPVADANKDNGDKGHLVPVQSKPVIHYDKQKNDEALQARMEKRKAELGFSKGIDLIVEPEDTIKIGESVIPMQEILDKIRLKKGDVIEKDLSEAPGVDTENELRNRVLPDERMGAYGIYVVQPLDNIWNIHFKFLKEYFSHKRISLTPLSDEPNAQGLSSGIGRLLKFSESMVYIYNLREHKLDVNLNLIQPLSKIVIFNMGQVFSLLEQIDYNNVNRIQFDGETLWIPAEQQ